MFNSEFVIIEISALVFVAVVGIITYYKWAFTYWEKRHLHNYEKPTIPFGNMQELLSAKLNWGLYGKMVYDKIKHQGLKHAGAFLFFKPFYVPIDPDLIKEVLQQRFDHFYSRGLYSNAQADPLTANLMIVEGEKWRYLHKKITPAFTTGKIKAMFDIFVRCGFQLQKAVETKCEIKKKIDFSDASVCYTLDIIGAYAYDLELNSFNHPNSELRRYIKESQDIFSTVSVTARFFFANSFPNLAGRLGVRIFPEECTNFFIGLVRDSVRFRKANNIDRKDLLQLLIENETNLDVEEIDRKTIESTNAINEIAAQVFIFLAAGYETSSIALAYCFYELSTNSYIQEKLRDEIDQVLANYKGNITYDAITDMKYMDQVVEETLRKYPALAFITRKCMKDCAITNTGVVVKKGTIISIPVLGIHHDPDYYPEPERFDPERFSDENKQKRPPFTYLPFSEGPRMCPGKRVLYDEPLLDVLITNAIINSTIILAYRFGLLQIKVGLTVLLQRFVFSLNKQTPVPLEMCSKSITLIPKAPIFLDIKKRNGPN